VAGADNPNMVRQSGDEVKHDSSTPLSLPPGVKAVISVLLAMHLAAVFIAPFAAACNVGGSSSPLADPVYKALHPYISALFLDHGYFFFAPNPGPSHLVDYKVEFDDGRPPVSGRFPNLATERPRLLYHRYFMLSEALTASYVPPEVPPEPSPPPLTASDEEQALYKLRRDEHKRLADDWKRRRQRYEAMQASIQRHLLSQYGGERVTLTRIEHRLPLPDEFQSLKQKLDAADSYITLPETITRASR
jgi:hypothetical protein